MVLGIALLQGVLQSLLFSAVGMVVLVCGLWLMRLVFPFDVQKEIEADQNVALGIVMGAFILGLAVIISAAISG